MQDKPAPRIPFQDLPARQHRRQMFLQVWLPLTASLVLTLALVTLAVIGTVQGSPQVNRWGNISAVFVIIPVLIFGLVLMALVGGLAYGVNRLLKKMPGWLYSAQVFMQQVAESVSKAADSAAQPVIKVNTTTSRVSAFLNRILRRKSTGISR
jgi:predicted PurR-regulated permease PerM